MSWELFSFTNILAKIWKNLSENNAHNTKKFHLRGPTPQTMHSSIQELDRPFCSLQPTKQIITDFYRKIGVSRTYLPTYGTFLHQHTPRVLETSAFLHNKF